MDEAIWSSGKVQTVLAAEGLLALAVGNKSAHGLGRSQKVRVGLGDPKVSSKLFELCRPISDRRSARDCAGGCRNRRRASDRRTSSSGSHVRPVLSRARYSRCNRLNDLRIRAAEAVSRDRHGCATLGALAGLAGIGSAERQLSSELRMAPRTPVLSLWLQRAETVPQVLRVPGGALAAALD